MPKKGQSGSKYRKVEIKKDGIRKQNYKEYAKIAVLAVFLLLVLVGGSYALFQNVIEGEKQTEIVSGILQIEYADKNSINLVNAHPISDSEGLANEGYTFTIKNIGTLNGKYTISLEEKEGNTLDKSNIKYSIKQGDGEWSSPVLLSSGLILVEDRIIESKNEETYQLKMWLKEDAGNEVQGQKYEAKIVVNTVQTNAENIVTTNPIIKLNGGNVVTLEQNKEYVEAGVNSVVSKEQIGIEKVTKRYEYNDGLTTIPTDKIDTSKVGIYYIYYEVTDSKGKKGIATRVVNIYKKGTNIPTITLKGNKSVVLNYKEKYLEAGYEASDKEDGDLTSKVVVEGVVNSEAAGTYIIKYIVIDSEGNTASATREVIVNNEYKDLLLTVTKKENTNISTTLTVDVETQGTKVYYAITNSDKKPGDSEYQELVNKTGTIEIVKNGTYYLYVKDNKGHLETKEIIISNIDETLPTCTFSEGVYVQKTKTKEVLLTCTDPADIATSEINKANIVSSDIETGTVEKVETLEKITNGYKYKITVLGKKAGNFTLTLKKDSVLDKAGNRNKEVVSSPIKVVEMNVVTKDIKLDLSGTVEKQIEVSGTNIGNVSYESTNEKVAVVTKEGIVKAVAPGTAIIKVKESNGNLTENVNVTVVKTLTSYFTKNGVGVSAIGKPREQCEIVDGSGKCSVTLPSITTTDGYEVIGWNKSGTAHEGLKPGVKVELTEDTVYYSISGKKVEITFNRNGAATLDSTNVESVKKSCLMYNDETTCSITSPSIEASINTPVVIGYSKAAGDHQSLWNVSTAKQVKTNETYYAQTKKNKSELKSQFKIASTAKVSKIENKSGVVVEDTTGAIEESCEVVESYNGVKQATTCKVKTPIITVAKGYKNGYWNKSKEATSGLNSDTDVTISNGDIYYANSSITSYTVTYDYKTNGGSSVSVTSKTVNYKEAIDLTPTATKEGFTFVGWNTDKNAKTGLSSLTMDIKSVTLYAIYKKTVGATFYYYDGLKQATTSTSCTMYNTATSCNYSLPSVVSSSKGPSNAAYKGVSGSTSSTTAVTLNSNTTKYYAYYTGTWTLSYTKGAGVSTITRTMDSCTSNKTTNGTNYTESTCSVTLPEIKASTGYTVQGWYNSSNTKVNSPYTINKTETLTSKTNINSYTVTYDYKTNGGSSATVTSKTVNYGSAIDFSPKATKSGYTFVGWNTNKDATSSLSSLTMGTNNVTLYAIYRKEAVTLTAKFNANGATLSSTSTLSCTLPAVYNNQSQATSCAVKAPSITRGGYNIIGYNKSASATSNSGSYSSGNLTITSSNTGSTWYAITSKTVGATFYYYDGSKQTSTSTSCTMYNTATSCNYSLPGVVSSSKGPSGTSYKGVSASASSTSLTTTYNSNTTKYYAVYQASVGATFYYYNGSAQTSTTASGTRTALTNGSSYSVSQGKISVPSAVKNSSGPSGTTYRGVSTGTSTTSTTGSINTGTTRYYAVYYVSVGATFYYYNGSAQTSTTASGTRTGLSNGSSYVVGQGKISVPSAVSSSSGPSGTTYRGVSTGTSTTSTTGSINTGTTKYYAVYYASVGATFYYYSGSAQTSTTASGTRTGLSNGSSYSVGQGSISIPSAVSSSSGPSGATYKGVSTSTNSTSTTGSINTGTTKYYAVYQGSWKATFSKGANVSGIGSSTLSCVSNKTSNGSSYTSTSCSVTAPTITPAQGYVTLGWFISGNSSNSPNVLPGRTITLSSNATYTAKVRAAVAREVSYDNTATGLVDASGNNCTDVQCAIDSINRIIG